MRQVYGVYMSTRCGWLVVFLLITTVARAVTIPFGFNFSVSNLGGPVSSISGSFTGTRIPFEGPWVPGPVTYDISTLSSVNLTIAGFTYNTTNTTLRVLTFPGGTGTQYEISSHPNPGFFGSFENNFSLSFSVTSQGQIFPLHFTYATPNSLIFFDEDANIATYRITPMAIPDGGASSVLLLLGLAFFAGLRRWMSLGAS